MNTTDLAMPPHDQTAEQAAVGAAIQQADVLSAVLEVSSPDDYYWVSHTKILQAAQAVDAAGDPVDPMLVMRELERRDQVGEVGGAPYLHTLMASVPSLGNAAYYAEIVADKATLRRLVAAATRITQLATRPDDELPSIVERCRAALDGAVRALADEGGVWTAEQAAADALRRYTTPVAPSLPTGWLDIDKSMNGGLRPGSLTIVGARPKVGKSFLGVALPLNAARRGRPSLVASLEMPQAELTDRMVAQLSGVFLTALNRGGGNFSADDMRRIEKAAAEVRALPLHVVDAPRQTVTTLRSRVRDFQRLGGCDLVVVDYLQLLTPTDIRAPRQEQVASMSRGLKLLAKEFHVPVVALAQINRGPEQRADRRPVPSDLRESGSIEADADSVWLLHREPGSNDELEVNIAYNRHGPAGTVRLRFSPAHARLNNLADGEAWDH